jgi:hypothetical protein
VLAEELIGSLLKLDSLFFRTPNLSFWFGRIRTFLSPVSGSLASSADASMSLL